MTLLTRHTETPRRRGFFVQNILGASEPRCVGAVKVAAIAIALIACSQAPAFAVEWTEFVDQSERFGVNFPGKPQVTQITYRTWREADVPAKVYTVKDGPRTYSVTVVNYQKVTDTGDLGTTDVLGSIAWAAWNVRRRPGVEIKYDAYAEADRIEGHEIYLVNPDKTQTSIAIFREKSRLYILEATVPAGSPPAIQFQQSLQIFDDNGVRVRYETNVDRIRKRVQDVCQ
jgi:hypothetical protein